LHDHELRRGNPAWTATGTGRTIWVAGYAFLAHESTCRAGAGDGFAIGAPPEPGTAPAGLGQSQMRAAGHKIDANYEAGRLQGLGLRTVE
jgi:hypothetical protein